MRMRGDLSFEKAAFTKDKVALFIYNVLICKKKVVSWMGKEDVRKGGRRQAQDTHSSEAVSYPPLEGFRQQ